MDILEESPSGIGSFFAQDGMEWTQGEFTDLSIDTCHRAPGHVTGHAASHVDDVTQQVLKAPVSELEELV